MSRGCATVVLAGAVLTAGLFAASSGGSGGGGEVLIAPGAQQQAGGGAVPAGAVGSGTGGACDANVGALAEAPATVKPHLLAAAKKHDVPPVLLAAIAKQESGFVPTAGSPAGAVGLMQLMPGTAQALGVRDRTDPAQSADGGAKYLKDMLNRYDGHVVKALAAYNAGPGAVDRSDGVPPYAETQKYVKIIPADPGVKAAMSGGKMVCAAPGAAPPGAQVLPAGATPVTAKAQAAYSWAMSKNGGPYVFGGNGPVGYDCSSFSLTALKQAGVNGMPRTADAQRQWCAAGNCVRVPAGQERRMDLLFWKSYLGKGPNDPFGHVAFVNDPRLKSTIDARSTKDGIGVFKYGSNPTTEIWRPKALM